MTRRERLESPWSNNTMQKLIAYCLLTPIAVLAASAQERTVIANFAARAEAVQARSVRTDGRTILNSGGVEFVVAFLDVRLPASSDGTRGLLLRISCAGLFSFDQAEVDGACLSAQPGRWYEVTAGIDGARAGFGDDPTFFFLLNLDLIEPPAGAIADPALTRGTR